MLAGLLFWVDVQIKFEFELYGCLYKLGIFVRLVVLDLLGCGLVIWLLFKFVFECVIL